jgi:hypothetical protein
MDDKTINDMTDDFDRHIEGLRRARHIPDTLRAEIDEAIRVFERLGTAKIIARVQLGHASEAAVLAVFAQLCAEARSGQATNDRP